MFAASTQPRAPMTRIRPPLAGVLAAVLLCLAGCATAPLPQGFRIQFIDQHTGRGVPAVEVVLLDGRSFVSDSAGVVALFEPDLWHRTVFFRVRSFGYRIAESLFGAPGTSLPVEPGRAVIVPLLRENVAERLYRITGWGIYRDSRMLGEPTPLGPEPESLAPLGMDSALATVYRGKLFWVWGDTRTAGSPLGNYRATGATSKLPEQGGLDPTRGIEFEYLRDGGQVRPLVDSEHPVVWLTALRAVRDAEGRERLFATYLNIVPPLRPIESGLVEFDDARGQFRVVDTYADDAPIVPKGHPFRHGTGADAHLHYDIDVRSGADARAVRAIDAYEAFTPLRSGTRGPIEASALERDASGRLVWAWKRATPPLDTTAWGTLAEQGHVEPREALYRLIDVETGQAILPHHGSVRWSPHRRRWIMIRSQLQGRSFLGEVYYGEADTPLGPWAYVRKIVTHAAAPNRPGWTPSGEHETTQSFYNPVQHPEFDRNGGRQILFEGTLSSLFSNGEPIPGYDYNQMMYSLDLEDPRLYLPVAIYRVRPPGGAWRHGDVTLLDGSDDRAELAFFAPDRPREGSVAMREVRELGSPPRLVPMRLRPGGIPSPDTRFYCVTDPDAPATVSLYERREAGGWIYTTDPTPGATPLCRVWPSPVDFPDAVIRGLARRSPDAGAR